MRMKYDFEENIKSALEIECQDITASRSLKERIDDEIVSSQKEAGTMKHLSVKKLIIGVAAACLLVGGGAFAAGHAVMFSSGTSLLDAYTSYDDMDKAQGKLGYAVDSVETFDNGYQFDRMFVDDVDAWDEDGNKAYTYQEMNIHYEKAGEPHMYLAIHKPVEAIGREKNPNATRTYGDIILYYDAYTYKFVPPSYELTEEDKANEERDDYYISYGSEEVKIQKSQGVTWEKDGIFYNLAGFDLNLSADEMFDMAEQIIGQE
ncbi:MAG: hypothetical protein J6K48_10610 [Lachnospiraceae bacterium]|nr:hypothetical protein [Lachnospiraceae bacterium]